MRRYEISQRHVIFVKFALSLSITTSCRTDCFDPSNMYERINIHIILSLSYIQLQYVYKYCRFVIDH